MCSRNAHECPGSVSVQGQQTKVYRPVSFIFRIFIADTMSTSDDHHHCKVKLKLIPHYAFETGNPQPRHAGQLNTSQTNPQQFVWEIVWDFPKNHWTYSQWIVNFNSQWQLFMSGSPTCSYCPDSRQPSVGFVWPGHLKVLLKVLLTCSSSCCPFCLRRSVLQLLPSPSIQCPLMWLVNLHGQI